MTRQEKRARAQRIVDATEATTMMLGGCVSLGWIDDLTEFARDYLEEHPEDEEELLTDPMLRRVGFYSDDTNHPSVGLRTREGLHLRPLNSGFALVGYCLGTGPVVLTTMGELRQLCKLFKVKLNEE
jgi:hypothetical protein